MTVCLILGGFSVYHAFSKRNPVENRKLGCISTPDSF